MSLTTENLDFYVSGDNVKHDRVIDEMPVGRTLTKAWMTIKSRAGDLDPGLVQKIITTLYTTSVGVIMDIGSDGDGAVLFELTRGDTGTTLLPEVDYVYDIQVQYDNGDIETRFLGSFALKAGVTSASS